MQAPTSNGSVIVQPDAMGVPLDYIINIATTADEFLPWGSVGRDRQLRAFWPTEHILAGALFTTIAKYVSFGWSLEGPPRTVSAVERVLRSANFGKGYENFQIRLLIDLLTQDNGAFIEFVRSGDSPAAPVVSFNNLDAARCYRTGDLEKPVKYLDMKGNIHELKWYQVATVEEFPCPIEDRRGIQYCALSRILAGAQIMKDITTYEHEKISGRFIRAVHLVGGIQTKTLTDALDMHNLRANSDMLRRYIQPVIVGGLDPTSRVTKETIELAAMPDHFDREHWMRWYINDFALCFGGDYQDYAPLPGGNLGTASQSTVLHAKGRGKGPALFMSIMENLFNYHGVIPQNTRMKFVRQDVEQETQEAQLRMIRAQERAARVASGEITIPVAQQIALDDGDLDEAYLEMMGQVNATGTVVADG